jgi:hypothetical protein
MNEGPSAVTASHSRLQHPVVALALLTLVLGATVAISWSLIGGRAAFQGPDAVLRGSWPAIYGLQAALAATALFIFARRRASTMRPRGLLLLVVGAWLGELLLLTLAGTLLANEIDPDIAWFFWLMGTGGPIQPVAAAIGGILGLKSRRDIT